MTFFINNGALNNISADDEINLKTIKQINKLLLKLYSLEKRRKLASKIPKPPGAAGIIKPIDQDKQKIINM